MKERYIHIPSRQDMRYLRFCGIEDIPSRSMHEAPQFVVEKYGVTYPLDPVIDLDSMVITYGVNLHGDLDQLGEKLSDVMKDIFSYIFDVSFSIFSKSKMKPLVLYSTVWGALAKPVLVISAEDIPLPNDPGAIRIRDSRELDWDSIYYELSIKLGEERAKKAIKYLKSERFTGVHLVEKPYGVIFVLDINAVYPITSQILGKAMGRRSRPGSWVRKVRLPDPDDLKRIIISIILLENPILNKENIKVLCRVIEQY